MKDNKIREFKMITLFIMMITGLSVIFGHPYKPPTYREPEIESWSSLIDAFVEVESSGRNEAYNSKSGALGCLQEKEIYVREVNRILGKKKYKYSDRTSRDKSVEMFMIYQGHHNKEKLLFKAIDLHNPGHSKEYENRVLHLYFANLRQSNP